MSSNYKKDLEFKGEGSIYFWLKANSVDYSSNVVDEIAEFFSDDGRVSIYKDKANHLVAKYEAADIVKDSVSVDVSKLLNSERHMVLFMWSTKDKFIELSVDATKVVKRKKW